MKQRETAIKTLATPCKLPIGGQRLCRKERKRKMTKEQIDFWDSFLTYYLGASANSYQEKYVLVLKPDLVDVAIEVKQLLQMLINVHGEYCLNQIATLLLISLQRMLDVYNIKPKRRIDLHKFEDYAFQFKGLYLEGE